MSNQFDELAKTVAQSVTRRAALKRFGVGLAGMALAALELANKGEASQGGIPRWCDQTTNPCCCKKCNSYLPANDPNWWSCQGACQLACGG
jgi:hypothetical protein